MWQVSNHFENFSYQTSGKIINVAQIRMVFDEIGSIFELNQEF